MRKKLICPYPLQTFVTVQELAGGYIHSRRTHPLYLKHCHAVNWGRPRSCAAAVCMHGSWCLYLRNKTPHHVAPAKDAFIAYVRNPAFHVDYLEAMLDLIPLIPEWFRPQENEPWDLMIRRWFEHKGRFDTERLERHIWGHEGVFSGAHRPLTRFLTPKRVTCKLSTLLPRVAAGDMLKENMGTIEKRVKPSNRGSYLSRFDEHFTCRQEWSCHCILVL